MAEEKKEIQFITCPDCGSYGVKENNATCNNCGGLGMGIFLQGEFLNWNLKIDRGEIFLRRLKHYLNLIVDILAAIIFISGLASLIYWIWQDNQSDILKTLLYFWREKSPFILYFYAACLALMFIFYRSDKKKMDEERIKNIKVETIKNFPNNWEELKKFNKKFDVSVAFRERTLLVLEDAYSLALKLNNAEVEPIHLFSSMLKSTKVAVLFTRLNVSGRDLVEKLNHQLRAKEKNLKKEADLKFSPAVKEILIEGFFEAYDLKQDNVTVLNLLLPCIARDPILGEILLDLKVDEHKIKNTIEWFRISERQVSNYRLYKKLAAFKPQTNMDRAYTAVATPLLNSYGYDLTLAAKYGRLGLCVARDKELEAIYDAFKSGARGVLLTGQDGVGKKTIIEGLAMEMVSESNVPEFLQDKRLIELDVARLISGADASAAQGRMLEIIDEINRAKNIILYISSLETIIGISAGQEQSLELSEVLAGEIERGALYCLASATDINYTKYIEGKAINKAFSRIKVKEPEGDQAIKILESKVGYLEARHNVFFSYDAIEAAIDLTSKFIHDKSLPEKAIEVMEKTAVSSAEEHKSGKYICTKNDIALTINKLTDIPVQDLSQDEGGKLLNLEDEIHKYMIDQEEAVKMVSDSLRRARTSLSSGKRPIANFLFLGPTGVGKTELAKTIMRVYFKNKDFLIRLDMSEYQDEGSVEKMIGDTNGTQGYLTEAVRQKPFSLILLDEFEKANPKIFNLFLQVMDDGRLTDGKGQTIDFTNSIIIATSNIGSEYIQDEIQKGTAMENIKNVLINEYLSKAIRPELVNRFDGVIVFKPLSEDDVKKITVLMLKDIEGMLAEKGIGFEANDAGITILAHQGFDQKFGARPLRRLIQDKIENEIARDLLSNDLVRRDTVIINDQAEIEIRKGQEL